MKKEIIFFENHFSHLFQFFLILNAGRFFSTKTIFWNFFSLFKSTPEYANFHNFFEMELNKFRKSNIFSEFLFTCIKIGRMGSFLFWETCFSIDARSWLVGKFEEVLLSLHFSQRFFSNVSSQTCLYSFPIIFV